MSANGSGHLGAPGGRDARKRRNAPGAPAPRRSARCLRTAARSDVSPSSPTRPQPRRAPARPRLRSLGVRSIQHIVVRSYLCIILGFRREFSHRSVRQLQSWSHRAALPARCATRCARRRRRFCSTASRSRPPRPGGTARRLAASRLRFTRETRNVAGQPPPPTTTSPSRPRRRGPCCSSASCGPRRAAPRRACARARCLRRSRPGAGRCTTWRARARTSTPNPWSGRGSPRTACRPTAAPTSRTRSIEPPPTRWSSTGSPPRRRSRSGSEPRGPPPRAYWTCRTCTRCGAPGTTP